MDLIDIGPEAFTNGTVINYRGDNFYKGCDRWVRDLPEGGQSFCVRREGHSGSVHEDYDGATRIDT